MKRLNLVLLVLTLALAGCQSKFVANLRGYEYYSTELDDYYRVIGEVDDNKIIEVMDNNRTILEEPRTYHIMGYVKEECQEVYIETEEGLILEMIPCELPIKLELAESGIFETYYFKDEEGIVTLRNIPVSTELNDIVELLESIEGSRVIITMIE